MIVGDLCSVESDAIIAQGHSTCTMVRASKSHSIARVQILAKALFSTFT